MSDIGASVSPSESAAILCGGLGSRLGDLTRSTPKPLLPVAGRPFIGYLLSELKRFGFRHVVLLSAFGSRQVVEFARSASVKLGLDISVSCEPELAGTGGALHHALDRLDSTFLLLNGDSWFDFNWLDLAAHATKQPSSAITLAVRQVDDAIRFGTLKIRDGQVVRFSPRPDRAGPGLVNGGVYHVRRDLLATRLTPRCSLEQDIIPELSLEGYVGAKIYEGSFIDIGVPDAFVEAQTTIPAWQLRPAVFLDRDAVLNDDSGYVGSAERSRRCAEAIISVKRFNEAGMYVFVVSSRANAARGCCSVTAMEYAHHSIQNRLRRYGAHIDDFRICPHQLEGCAPHRSGEPEWEAPRFRAIEEMMQVWPVERGRSVFIGDDETDVDAFRAAGIRAIGPGAGGLGLKVVAQVLQSISESRETVETDAGGSDS